MGKKAERAANTKRKVFDAAAEMFATMPYEEINMTDIAKRAGVSVGTIYHYFDSKYSVLMEYYSQQSESSINEDMMELLLRHMPPSEKVVTFFSTCYANRVLADGLGMAKQLYRADNKLLTDSGRAGRYNDVLSKIIKEGQRIGEITPDIPSDEIVEILYVTARGVSFDWCLHDGDFDLAAKLGRQVGYMMEHFLVKSADL